MHEEHEIRSMNIEDYLIVDESSKMPSIGVEALKEGGDIGLAALYALRAFREDLNLISKLGKDIKYFIKGLNKGVVYKEEELKTHFLKQSHQLFYSILVHSLKNNKNNVMDVLNRANVDVFKNGTDWYFKDSENGFGCTIILN